MAWGPHKASRGLRLWALGFDPGGGERLPGQCRGEECWHLGGIFHEEHFGCRAENTLEGSKLRI